MYNLFLVSNILRILEERGMTKVELSEAAGVSISFLSDLTKDKANPSLKTMVRIADALETPLPVLLDTVDLEPADVTALAGVKSPPGLPPGFVRICAVLPEQKAFVVRKWDAAARKRIREIQEP